MNWRMTLGSLALITLPLATIDSPPVSEYESQGLTLIGHDGRGQRHFAVDGDAVKGPHPGAVRRIEVTVDNPERFVLRIDRLRGRVVATSSRGCPVAGLRVDGYDGKLPVRVAAHGRTTLPGRLVVTMPANTTPKCASTRFTIELETAGARIGR
ncbi:hypothetical protein [Paractinoplanes durhamensis]|uniref:Uncharacterized protein n=1 Tax=Paractinoplanes durhamensis TaxID=113563 RepID=A0ABQ3YP91_9ACTN|nr:hypothetical protein [Actinoplanes durhamensis]GID99366.1 hypothetical protein Adu01nite_07170 [Actinoplanes durhamensis]